MRYEVPKLEWRYRETSDSEFATARAKGFEVQVRDCDGDFTEWHIKRGDQYLAAGTCQSSSTADGSDYVYYMDEAMKLIAAAREGIEIVKRKSMNKTYVIGDIHGRFDLLESALHAIFDRGGRDKGEFGTIITLGDYIDRGPHSKQVIESLMMVKATADAVSPGDMICLAGNHEDMLENASDGQEPALSRWVMNGGNTTLYSYDVDHPSRIEESHLEWMRQLPLMHVDKHRVYVHAGVDQNKLLSLQDRNTVLWHRYSGDDDGWNKPNGGGLHVVHGHTPHPTAILKPGRTNLDTGAFKTNRLTVGVFDDDTPGGPVGLITVTPEGASYIGSDHFGEATSKSVQRCLATTDVNDGLAHAMREIGRDNDSYVPTPKAAA